MATRLLDKMLARKGKTRQDIHPNSTVGKRLRGEGVGWTKELERIVDLPRRCWEEEDVEMLQEEISDWLKTPTGQQQLRPVQAFALAELHDLNGLLGIILVGGGKTLITFLAPLVLEALRPVLIVPASLREKTEREFAVLAKHWVRHSDLEIVNYEKLSRVSGADYLEERQPDLLIADECHKLKNKDAAVTRRVVRYLDDHPDTIFCGLSGTVTQRSVMDYHHLLRWALGPEAMPLPAKASEAMLWARALDEKLRGMTRMSPGELKIFVNTKKETVTRDEARVGYSRRLVETPGVVATKASDVDASIVGSVWHPVLSTEIEKALEHLKKEWETPGGEVCQQPVDLWRHARELVCGFYYYWDPEPTDEWRQARTSWFKYVREQLQEQIPGLDSPLQVGNACARGHLNSGHRYENWEKIKHTCKPKNLPRWIDDSVMQQVVERVNKEKAKSIVWVEQVAVGRKLAALSGWKFFGEGGKDSAGTPIEAIEGKETVIASIPANHQGRNLQAWHHNDIVSPPPNGRIVEQLCGRTHREGQEADEVYYRFMLGDEAIAAGLRQAIRDAHYIQQTTGTAQKLLLAGLEMVSGL